MVPPHSISAPIDPGIAAPPLSATPRRDGSGGRDAQTAPTKTKGSRLASLDWFRFVAVALMVQGHTFYEVLEPAVKNAPWYAWHRYVHGFTAPMFYFSSGLAFGITTVRGWDQHLGWTSTLKKRLERYGILLLIGYGMQAGDFSFRSLVTSTREASMPLLAVNTLQNIGVTLLLAECLVVLCRTVPRYRVAIAGLASVFVLFAPWAWRMDCAGLPVWLAAYVTDRTGSLFPLFPWSGYALAGILVSISLVSRDGRVVRADVAMHLLRLGASLAIGGKLLGMLRLGVFGEHNYWKTNPFFFLQRLGVIVLVFSALAFIERRASPLPESRALRFVETVAQETLVIYVGHLFLLYGTPWTVKGLRELYPETLSLGASVLAFLAVLVPMLAFAAFWHRLKKTRPVGFDRGRWAITTALVAVYLLNPGTL